MTCPRLTDSKATSATYVFSTIVNSSAATRARNRNKQLHGTRQTVTIRTCLLPGTREPFRATANDCRLLKLFTPTARSRIGSLSVGKHPSQLQLVLAARLVVVDAADRPHLQCHRKSLQLASVGQWSRVRFREHHRRVNADNFHICLTNAAHVGSGKTVSSDIQRDIDTGTQAAAAGHRQRVILVGIRCQGSAEVGQQLPGDLVCGGFDECHVMPESLCGSGGRCHSCIGTAAVYARTGYPP